MGWQVNRLNLLEVEHRIRMGGLVMTPQDWIKSVDKLPEPYYGSASKEVLMLIVNEDGDHIVRVGVYDHHVKSWFTTTGWIDETYEAVTCWQPIVLP